MVKAKLPRAKRLAGPVAESVVINDQEFVNPADYLPVGFGFSSLDAYTSHWLASSINDRQHGDDAPFIENEQDIALARGLARYITQANCAGVGILETLVNHVVGEGATFKASAAHKQCPPGLPEAAQFVVDQLVDVNDIKGMFDRELYRRDCRDGESFVGMYPKNGITYLRAIEPDFVTDPGGALYNDDDLQYYFNVKCEEGASDWKYGIHKHARDVRTVYGYCIRWASDVDWEYLPRRYVDHHKVNVDSNVSRGITDFYAPYQWLRQQERVLKNTGEGAAELAAIAYIIQHVAATVQQARDMRQGQADVSYTRTGPFGSQTIYKHRREPGTKLDVPKGQEYLPGPLGHDRGQAFLEVQSGILRQAAVRWQMTEGMVTGDDSNNNMASGIVAGSRFHKYCTAQQGRFKTRMLRIVWRAVQFAHAAGMFARFGVTFEEIMRLVTITCELPQVEVLEPDKQESIRETRKRNGVLSIATWQSQVGLNGDVERENGARDTSGVPGSPGLLDRPDGQPGEGNGTAAGAATDDLQKTALNGAQVTSLVDILTKAANGEIPDGAVAPIIQAAFPSLTPQQVAAIVNPLKGFTPSTQPGDGNGPIGAFGQTSRLQWKRNVRAIRDVLDELAQGQYTPQQAEAMLQTLGLPIDQAQKLMADVKDDGKLSPANQQQLAESYARHVSPYWRLVREAGDPWRDYP